MRHESWNLTGDKQTTSSRSEALQAIAEEFDAWAEAGRGDRMERGHWPTARQALDRIPWEKVSRFLDLGCGNGYAVRHAASRMARDGVAVGLDVSPEMVRQATERTDTWRKLALDAGTQVADVRFVEGAFDQIPEEDDALDVVFSNEALYYAPDVGAALAEVMRVLHPGGLFVCSIDFFEENVASRDWPEKVGVHMERDSALGWTKRFEDAGFVDVTTEGLLDPSGVEELPDDADEDARRAHDELVAWKTEIGTLLIVGRVPA